VKSHFVGGIHPQSNMFAMSVENNATGESKRNDSPMHICQQTTTPLNK